MSKSNALVYPPVDEESLGEHYLRHVEAMTAECLHDKGDIAAQLTARDMEIARLQKLLAAQTQADRITGRLTRLLSKGESLRKVHICTSCECVYSDAPVSSCDCMCDKPGFKTGVVVMDDDIA